MKLIIATLALSILGFSAHATVDVQGEATIVVENYHEEDSYFLRTVPTDFCIGIPTLTLAEAITQPVSIKANYGCGHSGDMVGTVQVNAATCAKITAEEVHNKDGSYNYRTVSIKKDLSKCGDKAKSENFKQALDNAIYNSYNASGYQIVEMK